MRLFRVIALALSFIITMTDAAAIDERRLVGRTTNSTRYVYAHFMVGIVSNRNSSSDWDADMIRAKAYGIDAFALNIGTDYFTNTQLGYAYASAANNGMKVFLSFDFNWFSTGAASTVGQMIAQYASLPAQLMVDGKVFVSTFVGDGVDVGTIRSTAGTPIYFAPNFNPALGTSFSPLDGAFNWMGWPNNGNNRAPNPGQTGTVEAGDQTYINALNGKDYMAPASPWFFTHYGAEVSYSKNWLFPGELLWYTRWQELLTLAPRFIEIVSWNDYGESHYVGPLSSPHKDDGASKWCNDMPHDAWLDMARPYIAAYKAGATSVTNYITSDQLIYWYRPQPMMVNCDATDTCMQPLSNPDYYIGRPNGYTTVSDSVFVVSLLTSPGTVQITSGNSTSTFTAPAGASSFTVPMGIGQQSFALTRGSQTVLSATSLKNIINGCVCGIYNFNAYVGSIPASIGDSLQGQGYDEFMTGLRVTTCSPTPSLGLTASSSTTTSGSTITSNPSTTTATTTTTPASTTSMTSSSTTTPITTTTSSSTASSSTTSSTTTSSPTTSSSTTTPTTTTTTSTTPSSTTSSATTSSSTTKSTTTPSTTTKSSTSTSKSSSTTTKSATTSSKTSTTLTKKSSTSTSTTLTTKTSTTSTTKTSSTSTLTSTTKTSTTTTTKSSTTTTKPTTTSSSSSTTTTSTSSSTTSSAAATTTACTGGTGSGNYSGLCSFCCSYGYCPPGPCTCTSTGPPATPPPETGVNGVPLNGDQSYAGLCSYACNHGYCPDTACKAA